MRVIVGHRINYLIPKSNGSKPGTNSEVKRLVVAKFGRALVAEVREVEPSEVASKRVCGMSVSQHSFFSSVQGAKSKPGLVPRKADLDDPFPLLSLSSPLCRARWVLVVNPLASSGWDLEGN
ncbi:hypothetical protein PanWU01x14_327760 [Parasponia andersonii]|uniref:Uncharacterized protein n=1 Tax=Parasponia andersonii TaxID=3476 RepID=A0A2P5AJ10_PARAD|nr:hypothetical protein PanWU01x14_327760 [Parasponia andersonii]